MNTTLVCTVGGSHQPIVRAIESLRPDFVCFVCSDDDPATGSKGSYTQVTGKGAIIKERFQDEAPTLPNIPTQTGLAEDQFEVLKVFPDDLDDIYGKVMHSLSQRDFSAERVVADYTGGTKSMSAGLVLAALDEERVDLQVVSGGRSNLIKVDSGAEQAMPASIESSRFRRQFDRALSGWQRYAYDETTSLLNQIAIPRDIRLRAERQRALDLSLAFAAWDRFDHATARDILMRYRPKLGRHWGPLFGTIDLLVNEERGEPIRILDLWRNAERRARQGRYDDAVARAYRLLEWTAQWILRVSAGIATDDVPEEKIPPDLALTKNRQGQYQAGLFAAWALAAAYGGDTIAHFWKHQQQRMLDYLKARNQSILAHGFSPLREEEWRNFAGWVEAEVLPLLLERSKAEPFRIHNVPDQLPITLPDEERVQP